MDSPLARIARFKVDASVLDQDFDQRARQINSATSRTTQPLVTKNAQVANLTSDAVNCYDFVALQDIWRAFYDY